MLVNELVGRWNMLVSFCVLIWSLIWGLIWSLIWSFGQGIFGLGFGQGNLVRQF